MKHIYTSVSIMILLLLCANKLSSQAKSYILSTNQNGFDTTYVARDEITLNGNFQFSGDNGNHFFHAKIDPTLIFPPAQNYLTPDGQITTNPAQGGIVGSLPGQFAVSPSGGATYSIPIECPSGVNGLQPNISLVYNSQGGDGPLGVGWNLSGISAISSVPKTVFNNDAVSGLYFHNIADQYALDGNLLYSTGSTYGSDGCYYYTQNKTINQITSLGSIMYLYSERPTRTPTERRVGPELFRVITKNGTIIEYGYLDRQGYTDSKAPFKWLISKITDTNGNYQSFSYSNYNKKQTVLSSIKYGSNNSNDTTRITFNYGMKQPINKKYITSIEVEDALILNSIDVISENITLKKYDIDYNYVNNKYYLSSITLNGENNIHLNPTTFLWSEKNDTTKVMTCPVKSAVDQWGDLICRRFASGDIDGDGFDDIIQLYKTKDNSPYIPEKQKTVWNTVTVKSSRSDGNLDQKFDLGDDFVKGCVQYGVGNDILIAEFNGDRNKSILVPYIENQQNPTINTFLLVDAKSKHNNPNEPFVFNYNLTASGDVPNYANADLNNDGIDEIIIIEKKRIIDSERGGIRSLAGGIYYVKKENNQMELSEQDDCVFDPIDYTMYSDVSRLFVSDFNNDGLLDLFLVTGNESFVYKNNGGTRGSDGIIHVTFDKLFTTECVKSSDEDIKTGDFNGDGLLDFFVLRRNNNLLWADWYLVLNTGNGFSSINTNISFHSKTSKDDDKDDCLVVDFNHDGKSDILLIDANYSIVDPYPYSITDIFWYKSNGTSFSYLGQCVKEDENFYNVNNSTIGDFNGDGYAELFNLNSNLLTGQYNNISNSGLIFYKHFNQDDNKITEIKDGMGSELKINYQYLSYDQDRFGSGSFYSIGNESTYPIFDVTIPFSCVNKVTMPLGNGTESIDKYSYSGLISHMNRGLLGFKKTTKKNALQNRTVITETALHPEYYNPNNIKTLVKNQNEDITFSRSESWLYNTKSGNVFISRPYITVQADLLTGIETTVEYIDYDDYDNPISIRTTKDDLIENQQISYGQVASFCPNKPIQVITTFNLGADTRSNRKDYKYDQKGNLIREVSDSTTVNQLAKAYDIDLYGNPITTYQIANGFTRKASLNYFAGSGKFVESKTNVLGETTTYNWDFARGVLNSETTNNKTTSYRYDDFGNLVETQYPDGKKTTSLLCWEENGTNGARYYSYSEASGVAPVKTWYDAHGRELKKESKGLNDLSIRTFTEYYSDGRMKRKSEPTFEDVAQTWAETYTYYNGGIEDGQVETITTPAGLTTYEYGLTSKVTSPSGTVEKTLFQNGLTEKVKQNGKEVSYTYYANGLTKTAKPEGPEGGQALTMEYDKQGNRTKLIDPDAGTINSTFNGFGEQLTTSRNMHDAQLITTTNNYEGSTGLLQNIVRNGDTTSYAYDALKRISSITIAGINTQTFTYDDFDRVTQVTETVGAKSFTTKTEYDALGREWKHGYPSGYYTVNQYDVNGYLTSVKDPGGVTIWEPLEENAKGQLKRENRGGRETSFDYDSHGLPMSIKSTGIIDLEYIFDSKGNLQSRKDIHNVNNKMMDSMAYDNLNRLTSWNVYTNGTLVKTNSQTYDPTTGNITSRTDLDNNTMYYGLRGRPHSLDSINGVPANFPLSNLSVTYTDFNKINTLNEGNKLYTLTYGIDDQRRKSVYAVNGVTKQTRYYLGDYEEEVDASGNIRKIHYLSGGAVFISNNGQDSLLFGYADYQGSLIALTDQNGTVLERYAYDPWGQRRDTSNWALSDTRTRWLLNRGYTGHEHLDAFGIINMNGRVYDPLTAQFFSPDPFVQAPGNWLNYNRYGYCYNNPFSYTDPDGEWIQLVIGAAFGAYNGYMVGAACGAKGWEMAGYIFGGAAIGVATGGLSGVISSGLSSIGVGSVISGAVGGAVGGAFSSVCFTGLATDWDGDAIKNAAITGAISGGIGASVNSIYNYESVGLINGILAGGACGAASGFISGGITNAILGRDLWEGAKNGMINGAMMGSIYGGLSGYNNASTLGVNKITGGTMDERAQAWANYFGMEDVKVYALTDRNIEKISSVRYSYEKYGSSLLRIDEANNRQTYIIDGLYNDGSINPDNKGIYLTKAAIRNMRFDGGWGKGTLYHEYYHAINGVAKTTEPFAYQQGLIYGGRSYYRHCKSDDVFTNNYKYYKNLYGL